MRLNSALKHQFQRGPQSEYRSPQLTTLAQPVKLYASVAPWQRALKRAADVVLSIVALCLFAVALPFIALAIKLDSRGSIFYGQTRVGINRRSRDRRGGSNRNGHGEDRRDGERRQLLAEGRPFTIYKLRTMYQDAESEGARWAEKSDPRITRVGHYLRLTRLDEFPQFWNVLCGDMSVVGPRPERPPFITLLSDEVPGYLDRLRFKPGITGLAQIREGYDTGVDSVERKVALDLEYITQFSLWRDVRILFETVTVVLTGRGAF